MRSLAKGSALDPSDLFGRATNTLPKSPRYHNEGVIIACAGCAVHSIPRNGLSVTAIKKLLLLLCAVPETALGEVTDSRVYNMLGMPGLIDMPSAYSQQDADFGLTMSAFRNSVKYAIAWQATEQLSFGFRYSMLFDLHGAPDDPRVFPSIFDRSFSVHYRLNDETNSIPAFAIGMNDIIGTGVLASEYLVASKTVGPRLKLTAGLGWGRLGSYGGFANPLGIFDDRFLERTYDRPEQGGTFNTHTWFHGDAALFGGLSYFPSNDLRLTLEYSSDAYQREAGTAFNWASPLNFGINYNLSRGLAISANYLYGSEVGVGLSWTFNPKSTRSGSGFDPAGQPMKGRTRETEPGIRGTDALEAALEVEGLRLLAVEEVGRTLAVQIENQRYNIVSQAIGRCARLLTDYAGPQIDDFRIIVSESGIAITEVQLGRDEIVAAEYAISGTTDSRNAAEISSAIQSLPALPGVYPHVGAAIEPYVKPSYFDPDAPLRADLGVSLNLEATVGLGITVAGTLQQRLLGNLDQSQRSSNSVLPHVRTDQDLYAKGGSLTIPSLMLSWLSHPTTNVYTRLSAGIFEPMFGGVSGEILWKPQVGPFALGAELNWVQQRDYKQLFEFQDYAVLTGHLSAYWQGDGGFTAKVSAGQYLAGDKGITVTLGKELNNGWEISAFATLTNVSPEQFGEGSFDKGFNVTIPLSLVAGRSRREVSSLVVHSIQRDGGAVLNVPGRLYDIVKPNQQDALDATWGRFWK